MPKSIPQTIDEENLEAFGKGWQLVKQRGGPASDAIFRLYSDGERYAGQASVWEGPEKVLEERFQLDTAPADGVHPMIARVDAMRELREKAEAARQAAGAQEAVSARPDQEAEARAITVERMSREEARAVLTANAGAERSVVFVKRTTGRVRAMRFRYEPGRRTPYDEDEKGLLPVFDLDEGAPRFINLDGVLR